MRDDDLAVAQEGRREGSQRRGAALEHRHQRLDAAPGPALARDIDIRRAGRLEREPHELAAPLDARPVEELIGHIGPRFENGAERRAARPPRYGLPALRGGSICGRMRSAALTIAARVVEELAVGRMVRLLHPLDMRPDRGMLLGEEFGEQVLLLRRADDEDRAGVGDRLGDILEERLVLLDPVAGALLRE